MSTCEPPAQSGGRCPPRGPRLQGLCSRPEARVITDLPPPPRLGRACGSGPRRAARRRGRATLPLSFPPGTDVSRCLSVCVYWGSGRVSLLVCVLWWTHFFSEGVSQHHGTAVCPALERPAGQASSLVYQVVLPAPSRQDPGRIIPGAALSALLTAATMPGLVTLMSTGTAPSECLSPPPTVCGGLLRSSPVLYGALRLAVALFTWMQVLSDVCCKRLLQPWVPSYPLVAAWEEHGSQSSAQQTQLSRLVSFFFNYLFLVVVGLGCCTQAFSRWPQVGAALCCNRLLTVMASLVAEHGLHGAPGL